MLNTEWSKVKQQWVNDRAGSVTISFTPLGDLQMDEDKRAKAYTFKQTLGANNMNNEVLTCVD